MPEQIDINLSKLPIDIPKDINRIANALEQSNDLNTKAKALEALIWEYQEYHSWLQGLSFDNSLQQQFKPFYKWKKEQNNA